MFWSGQKMSGVNFEHLWNVKGTVGCIVDSGLLPVACFKTSSPPIQVSRDWLTFNLPVQVIHTHNWLTYSSDGPIQVSYNLNQLYVPTLGRLSDWLPLWTYDPADIWSEWCLTKRERDQKESLIEWCQDSFVFYAFVSWVSQHRLKWYEASLQILLDTQQSQSGLQNVRDLSKGGKSN